MSGVVAVSAKALLASGDVEMAEQISRFALERLSGPARHHHPERARLLALRGRALLRFGRAAESEALLREVVDLERAWRAGWAPSRVSCGRA